jgi:hypothetical protein
MKPKHKVFMAVLAFFCCMAQAAIAAQQSVPVFLPPKGAMGSEYEQLAAALRDEGVVAVPVAQSPGPYEFWEDSTEGQAWGAPAGVYALEVTTTYGEVDLEACPAIIVGPGHGHTAWLGPSAIAARELISAALEGGIPVGGVSFGAATLVSWGFLDGRSAAMPPYYQGVVTPGTNKAHFLSEYSQVSFEDACVWMDTPREGTTILTSTYFCVGRFVDLFVTLF